MQRKSGDGGRGAREEGGELVCKGREGRVQGRRREGAGCKEGGGGGGQGGEKGGGRRIPLPVFIEREFECNKWYV